MTDRRVLITGIDGYVGLRAAERLLADPGTQLVGLVHATDAATLARKRDLCTARLGAQVDRVALFPSELGREDGLAGVDAASLRGVTDVVHAAAITQFNVAKGDAIRVNTKGTRQVLDLVRGLPAVVSLVHVSTLYASGLKPGAVPEAPVGSDDGFANYYEESKWQAETSLVDEYSDLPWRIARVATVIADDEAGGVTQQNVFHQTLRLFFYGLLSIVPGAPETPLYFVTGDFVRDALVRILFEGTAHQTYNFCHTRDESLGLQKLLDLAFEEFSAESDFSKKRIMKPLLVDWEAFRLFVDGMGSTGGGFALQALKNMEPFARQLYVAKEPANAALRAVVTDYAPPDQEELARNVCRHLLRIRWGRRDAVA